jgi:hypothetical protein
MRAIVAALGIFLASALVWPCVDATAQGRPDARRAREFHIEVNTLPGCFFAGCAQAVSSRNVAVTVAGKRVRSRVSQPPGGASKGSKGGLVHLLVAFAPGAGRPDDAELLTGLRQVLATGWLVSVSRSDGAFTPYAHETELRRDLLAGAAQKTDIGLDSIGSAIEKLRTQAGYRVLLVDLGGKSDERFVRWLNSVTQGLSPVYVSDGGKADMPYASSGEDADSVGGNAAADTAPKKERAFSDGVFHELKLASAISDAFADSRYEYDVRFRAAAGDDAQVKLTFLDPGTHLPYELHTELYTLEPGTVDGRPEKVRRDATRRLRTVEK